MMQQYQKAKRVEVRESANLLGEAEEMLAKVGNQRTNVHAIAARRLLQLCRENGGVYVKIGQHLVSWKNENEYIYGSANV